MTAKEVQFKKKSIVEAILNLNQVDLLTKIEELLMSNDKTEDTLSFLEKQEIEISRAEIDKGNTKNWTEVKEKLAKRT